MAAATSGPNYVDSFRARMTKLRPGETYVYHIGFLAADRIHRTALNMIASLAFGLSLAGQAQLFQKRLGTGLYEYRLRLTDRPIRNVDLDHGLKLCIAAHREEN